MKFTCEKNALVSAISVASRTVAQKSTIPALEGIYIRAGVKLTLSGYNLETGITISVDADIQETGACIMPSRLFFDIIRKLPDDTVSISVDENFKVSIRGGISSFSITAMSSEDYPELPEVDSEKGIDLPQSELKAMIGGTTYDKTADPSDGYANYQVTYDAALYSENGGPYTSDAYRTDETGILHYADHVLLTVHNRLDGNSGQIRVSKQFQNAAGKHVDRIEGTYTFGLYEEENPSGTPLMTASIVYRNGTSIPEDGIARFDGLKIGGSYHVYELDSSGRPILDGSAATIGGKPFLVSGSGVTVTVSQDAPTGEVTVTNCAAYPALPMTGGTGAEPFLLAGGLLSACAAAALALRRRRTHLSR